jgi:hypothetical protein
MPEDSDTSLGDTAAAAQPNPFVRAPQPETVLDLDEVMSQARRVEKVARICLRGDLQAEFDQLAEDLGDLVDADGRVLAEGDSALSDGARAQEIQARLTELKAEMKSAMRTIRFRALPEDDWERFRKSHLGADDTIRDLDRFNTELMAKTAVAPTLTVEAILQLRSTLGAPQITTMSNAAYLACVTGGVDVPKSPSYSPSQGLDRSEMS